MAAAKIAWVIYFSCWRFRDWVEQHQVEKGGCDREVSGGVFSRVVGGVDMLRLSSSLLFAADGFVAPTRRDCIELGL